ncbi:MAG: carboxypeptidase regulatory-like domain-containing protein [Planctomycetota bacterium]
MRWFGALVVPVLIGLVLFPPLDPPAAAGEDQPEAGKPRPKAGGTIAGTVKGRPKRYLKRGVLVYLEKVKGEFPPPKEHALMDQKNMRFVPHILPILVGTTVDFLNSDSVAHNVFSPDGEKYNLGTWPQGKTRSYTFKRTGVYSQLCHVHAEMEAFIVVLQNPHFARAGEDGKYEIKDVPPGTYTLVAWNERMKPARRSVRVTAGQATRAADFTLKRK